MREERPIIALDFPSFEDVKAFLEHFPEDEKLYVKIGMEFFYAIGPEIVHYLKGLGHSIFLDLKLHDIPNTVRSAMSVLGTFGIDMVCVTPGIRPAGSEIGDQKRVMTPQEAHQIGSDYIVVGRPIIQAENPWDAYHEIKKQWNS